MITFHPLRLGQDVKLGFYGIFEQRSEFPSLTKHSLGKESSETFLPIIVV